MATPLSVSELDPLTPKASSVSVQQSKPSQPKPSQAPKYKPQQQYSSAPKKSFFNSGKNTTLWFGIAIVVIVTITIAIIVGLIAHYGKELRKCRHELEKHKRESAHAQQLLENRMQQMDSQNYDFPPEEPIMDGMGGTETPWVTEGTDPMGSRTKRDGAMMGDVIMDRELRNRQRLSPGTLMFPPRG